MIYSCHKKYLRPNAYFKQNPFTLYCDIKKKVDPQKVLRPMEMFSSRECEVNYTIALWIHYEFNTFYLLKSCQSTNIIIELISILVKSFTTS